MLAFRRTHELRGVDAGRRIVRSVARLQAPGVRTYVARMTGGQRFDAGLLRAEPAQLAMGEEALCVVFGGELVVRRAGVERTLGAGAAALMDVARWDERWEGEFSVLVVEWGQASSSARPRFEAGTMAASDRAALGAFADDVASGSLRGEAAAVAVARVSARLAAAGLPLPRLEPRLLWEGLPRGAQAVADALGDALSDLSTSPQLIDLVDRLGVGERQVRRALQALGPWLPGYAAPSGWRRKLRQLRTHVASGFLAVRGVSQEAVARSVGYGSARAMALAFEQEGLAPPSAFRHA